MNEYFAIGQRITLYLFNARRDARVVGHFHSFNAEKTRITLTNVTLHPEMLQLKNMMHYFFCEIQRIEADRIEEPLPAYIDRNVGRSLAFCKGPGHPHLSYLSKMQERGEKKKQPSMLFIYSAMRIFPNFLQC